MAMWEVAEGDAWQAILTKAIEDDYDKGSMDIYGGMNPFSTLAWASTAKSHEQHFLMLEENVVPCLIVAGKKDPLVPYKQSEMLAAKTGRAILESHVISSVLHQVGRCFLTLLQISSRNNPWHEMDQFTSTLPFGEIGTLTSAEGRSVAKCTSRFHTSSLCLVPAI